MNFILAPGFWLTAESWSDVSRKLLSSGVEHVALTLPGLERGGNNARLHDVSCINLPTGHRPQFTRPDDLAGLLIDLA